MRCTIGSQQKGSGQGGWDELIHGFIGQSENFALCSVSTRKPSKALIKAEE